MAALALSQPAPLPAAHPCAGCPVREIAVCSALDCDNLAQMRGMGGTARLEAGDALFHEGDPAGQVFTLTQGSMKLYKLLPDGRRYVVGFLYPGDYLGITLNEEHAFTAEAMEPVRACRFSRGRFDAFAQSHPELERQLYRYAANELSAAQAQMVLLGRKSATERLASFFVDLLHKQEKLSGRAESVIRLPMSRTDIADYLGLTKETISRVLGALKRRRLIRLAALDRVEVIERAELEALGEGSSFN